MIDAVRTFTTGSGEEGKLYSLPALKEAGWAPRLERLPTSIRIVLESVLRNCDGKRVTDQDVRNLANYNAASPGNYEIPFVVARIVLQDFTGVPLLVDLAAMRSAVARLGADPTIIEPLVTVDLVVDHSVQVDFAGSEQALARNLELEFQRNRERYQFLKWGEQAFDTFNVVPPGIGIVHQVNLEYLAKGVLSRPFRSNGESTDVPELAANRLPEHLDGSVPKNRPIIEGDPRLYYPDTLVGTDSHTTMINGLGVVGWGVGGIEAEAGMLGQPVTFLVPEVVGVLLTGSLQTGITATDLVLRVTELLRRTKVVGKFVEFFGPGAQALGVPDRATLANMAPEYGATVGFFGVDEATMTYLRGTGRSPELCGTVENYFKAQGLWGIPGPGEIDYTHVVELDLTSVKPSVAGPKRPQDRIDLDGLKERFEALLEAPIDMGGFGKSGAALAENPRARLSKPRGVTIGSILSTDAGDLVGQERNKAEMTTNRPAPDLVPVAEAFGPIDSTVGHGSVVIAAITSCTNTSNPSVMLAAGLLAKKAVERGLRVPSSVKTSLAPGSRVVTDYLNKSGLQPYLDQLGFQTVGYGCTTCIGNSGPLHPAIEDAIKNSDLVCASVLSGNRNFEARVHQSVKANFLMSPPLVVAFAIAGTVDVDLANEPLGIDREGQPVFLRELWPSPVEIASAMRTALAPEVFQRLYTDFAEQNPMWNEIPSFPGLVYQWDEESTYIQEPPFFEGFSLTPPAILPIKGARPLGIFGDSVTTDHISPAGSIRKDTPAGRYLLEHGVEFANFNSYGSRRGNDCVMTRGTFANVRIKNLMVPETEGGVTRYFRNARVSEVMPIFDAASLYKERGIPLIVIAGEDYGMGSSRDWAAKGTTLLGVKAVIAKSFERIHRSNLIGMGVLPCTFRDKDDYDKVKGMANATFDLLGLTKRLKPQQEATLRVRPAVPKPVSREENLSAPEKFDVPVIVRLDTPMEIDYYRAGGILPYVLAQIIRARTTPTAPSDPRPVAPSADAVMLG